jgi:hypothetical protein
LTSGSALNASTIAERTADPSVLMPDCRNSLTASSSKQIELRDKAATGMKLCRDELAKELINLDPD